MDTQEIAFTGTLLFAFFDGLKSCRLLYPGQEEAKRKRCFDEISGSLIEMGCSIISIPVKTDGNIKYWQQAVNSQLRKWIGPEEAE